MSINFVDHAKHCELLLNQTQKLDRLDADQLRQFHDTLDENKRLLNDPSYSNFSNELNFYNKILTQILENQYKYPRPSGP